MRLTITRNSKNALRPVRSRRCNANNILQGDYLPPVGSGREEAKWQPETDENRPGTEHTL